MKTATAVIVLCTVVIVYLFFTVSHYISTIIDSKRPLMKITQTRKLYNYLQEMDKLNIERVQMDDPRLIHLIRNYWIENPSEEPYNLKSPDEMDPSIGQAAFVDNRLNFQENGFYVECGALDGESRSNTLLFERLRNWNGLLIEADPKNYRLLKMKHRKAFTINACLSIYPYPVKMKFRQAFNLGKIIEDTQTNYRVTEIQCFPLYSILLALNVTTVDFFSLDVEGSELQVLKTIPFKKLNIRMITTEFIHIQDDGEHAVKKYVEGKGYSSLLKMQHYRNLANDIIFKKR